MKIRYFAGTDTLYVEMNENPVVETREINENTLIDLDADGNPVALTLEHTRDVADLSGFAAQQIELPDQLTAEVKVLAAREGRKLGELMAELVRAGLESRTRPIATAQQQLSAEQWLEEWLRLGEETLRDAPPGPTATEILAGDRNRLDPRAGGDREEC